MKDESVTDQTTRKTRHRIAHLGLWRRPVLVLQVGCLVEGVCMPAGGRLVEPCREVHWRDARPDEFLETANGQ